MRLRSWSHFYQKNHWVQMSLHYQVKLRWVSGSLKGRLVVQRYSHVHELDYMDTFSPIANMTYVRVLASLAATYHCLFIIWTSKMSFSKVFLMRKFAWSNHQILLLRGCVKKVCTLKNHYTVWNSPREPDLGALHQWFMSLIFATQKKITLYFDGYRMGRWFC